MPKKPVAPQPGEDVGAASNESKARIGVYALRFKSVPEPYIGKALIDFGKRHRRHLDHLRAAAKTGTHKAGCCVASYAEARHAFARGDVPTLEILEELDDAKTCSLSAMEFSWWSRLHANGGWQVSPGFAKRCAGPCDHFEIEEYLAALSSERRSWHAAKTPEQRSAHALRIHVNKSAEQRADIVRKSNASRPPEQRSAIAKRANAAQTVDEQRARQRKAMADRTPEERSAIIKKGHARRSLEQRSEEARHRWASLTPEQRSERIKKANALRTPEARSASAKARQAARTPEQLRAAAEKAALTIANMTASERSARSQKAAASQTPEQRSEKARKAMQSRTPEQRAESQRKAWETRRTNASLRANVAAEA